MRLNQLKQFKAIIDYGGMNNAAKKLYISQSAISQNLDKLEQEIGVKFFDRLAGGKLKLNSNGEKMLGYVNQMLSTCLLYTSRCVYDTGACSTPSPLRQARK